MEKRLDVYLCENGYYKSREKAKEAISSSRVKVNEKIVTKPSFLCEDNAKIEALPFEFVSRGGFKLQKALEDFDANLTGKVVLDIGASTGGFTDVCLQNGARFVYAVDTGEGQLDESLKNNKNVKNLEKTNYLHLPSSEFKDVNFVVIDVSFVSLTHLSKKLASDFEHIDIIALIKPQFECGVEYARKHKGIVKDEKVHKNVIEKIKSCFQDLKFDVRGVIESPIKGGDGNTEFLIYLSK